MLAHTQLLIDNKNQEKMRKFCQELELFPRLKEAWELGSIQVTHGKIHGKYYDTETARNT